MLPKKLIIKGLYSYQEEQEINFEKLTEAGIFGIFGSVGSGKSSILEAIGFALYGKTERLGERENRNYNMMNLRSNELLIDFEFVNFDDHIYRFRVDGKRNGRNFEDVNTFKRRAFKWENEEWIPLESTDASTILDLSYDNFRRTIIIPQGKFQEFLQLGSTDRTSMMMDIFHLHKYDLSNNIKVLENENNLEIAKLQGQILAIGAVSKDDINRLEENLEKTTQKEKETTKSLLEKEEEWKALSLIKQKTESLALAENNLEKLKLSDIDFEARRTKLDQYKQAKYHFEADFSKRQILEATILQSEKKLEIAQNLYSESYVNFDILQKERTEISPKYATLDTQRQLLIEYDIALEALTYKSEFIQRNEEIAIAKEMLEIADGARKQLSIELTDIQKSISSKNINKSDNQLIFNNINNWFLKYNHVKEQLEKAKNDISYVEDRIKNGMKVFADLSLSFENWGTEVAQIQLDIDTKLKTLNIALNNIRTQKELHQYSQNLEEGKPCPLCGALHHPDLLKDNVDLNTDYQRITDEIIQQEDRNKLLSLRIKDATRFESKIQELILQKKQYSDQHDTLQKSEKICIKEFKWLNFNYLDENYFKSKYDLFLTEVKQTEEQEALACTLQSKLDDANEKWNQQQIKQAEKKASLDNLQHNYINSCAKLKQLDIKELEKSDKDSLIFSRDALSNQISNIQTTHDSLLKKIADLEKEIAVQNNNITHIKNLITQYNKEHNILIINIKENLSKHNIEEEDIKEILKNPINIEAEEDAILKFTNQLFAAEAKVKEQTTDLQGEVFDPEKWNSLAHLIESGKIELVELNKTMAQWTHQLSELKLKFEALVKVEQLFASKNIRKENINELKKLFFGNGFVNYISSVYLKNLCRSANIRFMKLTQNHLQLELNEGNEFVVRDMLNDGKIRSAKTLSGGQIFQASLSLALALADSVYSQQKSKQNFFFLDEGFGALDKDALSVIMQTLKSLQKENRIVGIISHVEELQQEIPISLVITNNAETGSKIGYN